jgi:glycerophosphoryl diester phosphodiesterase
MLPIRVPDDFRIIAHRGASAYAPENTGSAFRLAVEMGVFEVELDTQVSTDRVVVLCHDTILQRYGHGPRVVEEMSSKELLALDMGAWFSPHFFAHERMMTLSSLLDHYRDKLVYHVELKGRARHLPDCVHGIISGYGLEESCIITSFSYDHLVRMHTIAPHYRLAWLVQQFDQEVLDCAGKIHVFQLCPRADLITHEMVQTGRSVAQEIRAWGVLGSSLEVVNLMKDVIDSGCDGMTINWPDWVVHQ